MARASSHFEQRLASVAAKMTAQDADRADHTPERALQLLQTQILLEILKSLDGLERGRAEDI